MAALVRNNSKLYNAMERTGQWIFSQEIPADVIVEVGEAKFPLHEFMLVAKSNYIRKLIIESNEPDLKRINLSEIPGGADMFEKAAMFCYCFNFEITVHNVAGLRCAAEFLQMTESYCNGNLAGRAEAFLSLVALSSLSGAVVVLRSCEDLLPMAEELSIVQRCIDVISVKACNEAKFPSRSPPKWWTEELSIFDIQFLARIIASMKKRGTKPLSLASVLITYTERNLRDLVRDDHSGPAKYSSFKLDPELRIAQRELLESIVSLLPTEKAAFPAHFLCCLLRSAIFLDASSACKNELEKRIAVILEQATVDDLMVVSYTYDGERLVDLESARNIISGFVEKERNMAVFGGGSGFSPSMLRVAKTVDAYLGEIAAAGELSISKFNGIAVLVPKGARKADDDLYRAIDIYLKAHPNLDEIKQEKVCSVMDPLKLSYEARLHASQNKRLPVQIVLHALYYDQLKIWGGSDEPAATLARNQLQSDMSLIRENESLRSELMKMKLFVSGMQITSWSSSTRSNNIKGARKQTFFSSMSKTLGKFNPFKHGSKDTSQIDEDVGIAKPRRRRFSIS